MSKTTNKTMYLMNCICKKFHFTTKIPKTYIYLFSINSLYFFVDLYYKKLTAKHETIANQIKDLKKAGRLLPI